MYWQLPPPRKEKKFKFLLMWIVPLNSHREQCADDATSLGGRMFLWWRRFCRRTPSLFGNCIFSLSTFVIISLDPFGSVKECRCSVLDLLFFLLESDRWSFKSCGKRTAGRSCKLWSRIIIDASCCLNQLTNVGCFRVVLIQDFSKGALEIALKIEIINY